MINGFVSAVRTLTRIPIAGKDTKDFAKSLPWFPVVGFLLASILSGIILTIDYFVNGDWNQATALLILLSGTLLTGALHLDGFADWADSLGAKGNKKKMLEIMKDSNSGAFGIVAIVLLLLAKWIVLIKLLEQNLIIISLFIAFISSRFAMVYFSVTLSYARIEGGTGEHFIKNAKTGHLIYAFVISTLLLYLIGNIYAIVFFILSFIVILFWAFWCNKNLNGITGDLLGAGSEFVEVFTMYFIALFYNDIFSLTNHISQIL